MKISPDTYKRMAAQHVRLKSMKQGQFIQWACSFWQNAYNEGFADGKSKGIDIPEDIEVEIWNEEDLLTLDDVFNAMLSIKGIGIKRATAVIELLQNFENKTEQ